MPTISEKKNTRSGDYVVTKELVRQSNLIEGFDDPAVDAAAWRTWEWFRRSFFNNNPLVHKNIQRLNARLTEHQPEIGIWSGAYRSRSRIRVQVGGREGAKPEHIDRLMDEWIEDWYRDDPITSHIKFELIHPFIDGNGRTGRMLMWVRQSLLGEPISKITKANVQDYYKWFQDGE